MNEPSVIALNSRSGEVLAMGHEAWQMIGRTPSYIVAVRPLRKGAITDFDVTQRMIRLLLQLGFYLQPCQGIGRAKLSACAKPVNRTCTPYELNF